MTFRHKTDHGQIGNLSWRGYLFHPKRNWALRRFVRTGKALDYWRHEYFLKGSLGMAQRMVKKERDMFMLDKEIWRLRRELGMSIGEKEFLNDGHHDPYPTIEDYDDQASSFNLALERQNTFDWYPWIVVAVVVVCALAGWFAVDVIR